MADKVFDFGHNGITRSEGFKEDGQIITTETMPGSVVEHILNQNKILQQQGVPKTDMGVVGARIPITLHHKWKQEWMKTAKRHGIPWHKFLKGKINSPEYKHLRFMKI